MAEITIKQAPESEFKLELDKAYIKEIKDEDTDSLNIVIYKGLREELTGDSYRFIEFYEETIESISYTSTQLKNMNFTPFHGSIKLEF